MDPRRRPGPDRRRRCSGRPGHPLCQPAGDGGRPGNDRAGSVSLRARQPGGAAGAGAGGGRGAGHSRRSGHGRAAARRRRPAGGALSGDPEKKILLTTEKPIYQPGQVIHLRALALSSFDRAPASGSEIEFIIADGKGNKVFRRAVETSAYGVAAEDFQLANEVNTGNYKITAQMGNTSSERTVTVEHYVLPKFEVVWATERSFYLPGERVQGSINAEYFYGKTVEGGQVRITGFTFDFERQEVFTLEGTTDAGGVFEFDFTLPDYVAGSDLEGGAGRFYLEAAVTDLAQHTESSSFSLPVSQSRITIEAIPESGQLRPGVENILYVLTSYPDGAPAQTTLNLLVNGIPTRLQTGEFGLAEHPFP